MTTTNYNPPTPPHSYHLTGRQIQVLQELSSGRSNKEIATQLHITERTVKFHVASIYEAFHLTGYRNRVLLVRLAIQLGFVEV